MVAFVFYKTIVKFGFISYDENKKVFDVIETTELLEGKYGRARATSLVRKLYPSAIVGDIEVVIEKRYMSDKTFYLNSTPDRDCL